MTSVVPVPGWEHVYSGKVRDLYRPLDGDADRLLVVASDRVSAFDHVLEPGIPGKGSLLTGLSLWWFGELAEFPSHVLPDAVPDEAAGRAMVVKRLRMYPIECVVRGYLTGSGWVEYQRDQAVCGVPLPAGLRDGDRLPQPIFTPAFKAELGAHDENITFGRVIELVGGDAAEALRSTSLAIFERAARIAEERGLVLVDTKFEFGDDSGMLTLGDEVLTSDSSRYWDAAAYAAGKHDSFDKQIVRNWLSENWPSAVRDTTPPPVLPDEIVERTAARYRELVERLTGRPA
ncbi:phosphoribosylaminoimidazolesuccinocarboxamide synthase [Lysobacter korlensis]|uniref:Phosphoribosylaminoimidazole-succinocarboxamide synthase n=1 Tax=Lysobacter korlensis TaxID=553636 RepID=A0ABV6RU03_9GAMM